MRAAAASLIGFLAAAGAVQAADDAPAFRTRILPILTKAGCNTGACHGAATGQGGFRLSLYGSDPEEDYERITRESGGRRIDLGEPGKSLVLLKPADEIDHEGGRKLRMDSDGWETVRKWIAAGAPYGPRELQVTGMAVTPGDTLVEKPGEAVSLRVTATLSDGSTEEVTALALYSSNDDAIAEVSKAGEVTVRGRGLTSIMVRYSGQAAAARIAAPYEGTAGNAAEFPSQNFIDDHIGAELRRLRLPASPLSGGAEFLRRAHLDLTGLLPDSKEAREFSNEPDTAERRLQVIDALLERPEFVDFWTMRLADLLLIGGKGSSEAAAKAWHGWLREQVRLRAPLNEVVRQMLTATGSVATNGPANFYTLASDPRDLAEHASRMFLGTQIACARCHGHPGDRWTQEDYHRFAACFARVERDGGVIRISTRGEVEHPKTGKPLGPKPLGAPAFAETDETDRRVALADWLTAADNPLFARSLVNRVWKHMTGRGLAEPVDDLRPSNPPTHPALLDALTADFVKHRFDLRHLVRTIAASRTWQLTSAPVAGNAFDERLFSHARVREMPAQVFTDAVVQVTGMPESYNGYPEGTRAVQLIGPQTPSAALDVLGRCMRDRSCETGSGGGGLARALHLINGDTIQGKLRGGVSEQLLADGVAAAELITELYLRSLSRFPSEAELAEWEALFSRSSNRQENVEDLLWTLLNSREFGFNH